VARVKIWKSEIDKGLLPRVCMVCGADADRTQREKFSWVPQWVVILILAGPLVWAIVAAVLRKSMAVDCPVCEKHVRHWFWRKAVLVLGLLGTIAGVLVGILLVSNPETKQIAGYVLVSSFVFFLLVLVVAAVYSTTGIRPVEITDKTITLTSVHREFVDALEDDRARDEEEAEREYQERKARPVARRLPSPGGESV
jgi:uncharacterized protein YacL